MKMKIAEEMHQHVDASRIPFGKLHPISEIHKKKMTQAWHDHTICVSKLPVEKSYRKLDT
jgi:hypothetical protein